MNLRMQASIHHQPMEIDDDGHDMMSSPESGQVNSHHDMMEEVVEGVQSPSSDSSSAISYYDVMQGLVQVIQTPSSSETGSVNGNHDMMEDLAEGVHTPPGPVNGIREDEQANRVDTVRSDDGSDDGTVYSHSSSYDVFSGPVLPVGPMTPFPFQPSGSLVTSGPSSAVQDDPFTIAAGRPSAVLSAALTRGRLDGTFNASPISPTAHLSSGAHPDIDPVDQDFTFDPDSPTPRRPVNRASSTSAREARTAGPARRSSSYNHPGYQPTGSRIQPSTYTQPTVGSHFSPQGQTPAYVQSTPGNYFRSETKASAFANNAVSSYVHPQGHVPTYP
jgi:hypothetical protein